MPLPIRFLLLTLVGWIQREQQAAIRYLQAENETLQEQLGHRRLRYTRRQRRRLAEAGQALARSQLCSYATLVTPDTILRWYREYVAKRYDGSKKRSYGRPRAREALAPLTLRLAQENPSFGYGRLVGALANLGRTTSRSTVKRILDDHGVVPAPERDRAPSWSTFLAAHWDGLAAGDFFSVEVMTWRGVVRYSVFFAIELATRRVEIAGLSTAPEGAWVEQLGRNLLDGFEGFLLGKTHLILDRDPLYTRAFKALLASEGAEVVTLPARSPNLNAYAERFVRSIKSKCLDRMVILGEATSATPSEAISRSTTRSGITRASTTG